MSTTTARRARAPFLFSARAGLGADGSLIARSFSRELQGVFTRAYPTHIVDRAGVLALTARGVPAFGTIGGDLCLVTEPEATNVLAGSEDLGNLSYHSLSAITVSANARTAPNRTLTADKIVESATTAAHFHNPSSFSTTPGTRYSASIFVEAGERTVCQLLWSSGEVTNNPRANFDLASGQWGTVDAEITARAVALGGGRYRLSITSTAAGTVLTPILALAQSATDGRGPSYAGNGTSGLYAWGWQLEVGNPTSYIATAAAQVTRAATSLYFPFQVTPQPLTAYVRFREMGTAYGTNEGLLSLGSGDTASVFLLTGGAGSYYAVHRRAADQATATVLPTVAFGDLVELSVQLLVDGSLSLTQRINSGAVSAASVSAANAYASAFDVPRLYLGSRGSLPGAYGITDAAVDFGARSLVEMASLCEVG